MHRGLLPQLDSDKYLVFLQEIHPELLIDVPAPVGAAHGFIGTGWHLIIEGVYVIIWNEHFQTDGMDVVVSQIPWFTSSAFFFVRVPWRVFGHDSRYFWNWLGGTNNYQCCYDPWNGWYFRICISIHVALVSWVHTYQRLQIRTHPLVLLYHAFYLFIYCVKAFYNAFCCGLNVFVSFLLAKVTLPPMLSDVIMAL